MSNPDPRLFCNCGEIGEVKAVSPEEDMGGLAGFRVFCKRNDEPCCMTQRGDTPEAAIVHWDRMNAEKVNP